MKHTREAIPEIQDHVDQEIEEAETFSQSAGKGAVSGVVKGVVTAPFNIVSGVGKSAVKHMGLHVTSDMTETDFKMIGDAIQQLAKIEETGTDVKWDNPESGNSGEHTLVRQYEKDKLPCKSIDGHIQVKEKERHYGQVEICRQPDGAWEVTEKKIQ